MAREYGLGCYYEDMHHEIQSLYINSYLASGGRFFC